MKNLYNRLSQASSPYLKQHSGNPVHWQPWDEQAFSYASKEEKPVFLSVGYSSCHWCHVMEHESFEDPGIADLLNQHFVSIKVDREERPDVDDAYMAAVQLATGRGGWPMTLFLTPDKKPFFAATYLPRDDTGGRQGFRSVLMSIAAAWKENRKEVLAASDEFSRVLERHRTTEPSASSALTRDSIDGALETIAASFDAVNGGFGTRPKFPPHSAILLYLHRVDFPAAAAIVNKTLDSMSAGGIHDHVGGGFHRYSTDERWHLPHFEKMLYDNALLLKAFAVSASLTHDQAHKRVCDRIITWLKREMTSIDGLLYSAIDADSDGEEGLYYTWTQNEIENALGRRSDAFIDAFGIRKDGNYFDEATGKLTGRNVLIAQTKDLDEFDEDLEVLRAVRSSRIRPEIDNKALVAWNGLAVGALAKAGEIAMASRIADALMEYGDSLPHQIVSGKPEGRPFLDTAYLVEGLLDLHEASGESKYLDNASRLFESFRGRFRSKSGGWFFTSTDHENLFGLNKPVLDSSMPSPSSVMALCAIRLGLIDVAREDLESMHGWMEIAPSATETAYLAASMYFDAGGSDITPELTQIDVTESEVDEAGIATFKVQIKPPTGWRVAIEETPLLTELGVAIEGLENPTASLTTEGQTHVVTIAGKPGPGSRGAATAELRLQLCTDTECRRPESRMLELRWRRAGAPPER
ncbi:MAG: thioredoxin domain-containing protein [Fimbriimonadales bacterium]|nr:thioredoxin domain-containing protein [Fimbriimonadales bacterium]